MRYSVVGIDVGTSEIKACLSKDGKVVASHRSPTPSTGLHYRLPLSAYTEIVLGLLSEIVRGAEGPSIVSIVAQAPSLCMWDGQEAVGLSYLAEYGRSQDNGKDARRAKTQRRLEVLQSWWHNRPCYLSGLTGYLVAQLTNVATIDTVTAWECGIESEREFLEMAATCQRSGILMPNVCSPLTLLPAKRSVEREISAVLVGATDSAALPASFWPEVYDYYLYLGTWGCLLKSALVKPGDLSHTFVSGQVHKWLVSVSGFADVFPRDPSVLRTVALSVLKATSSSATVGVAGGILLGYRGQVRSVLNEVLAPRHIAYLEHGSVALGAANLATFNRVLA